jgi:L-asparaginase II
LENFEKICRSGPLTPLHNNCSGKHAGLLAAAKFLGQPLTEYLSAEHPLQKQILELVSHFSGENPSVAVDGCGLPTFRFKLRTMATMYARLMDSGWPTPYRSCAARIVKSMTAHSEMVGGTGHLDTEIMKRGKGMILLKGGAEGLLCGALTNPDNQTTGFAIKVEDGASRPRAFALEAVFKKIPGWCFDPSIFKTIFDPIIRNHAGHEVGLVKTNVRWRS